MVVVKIVADTECREVGFQSRFEELVQAMAMNGVHEGARKYVVGGGMYCGTTRLARWNGSIIDAIVKLETNGSREEFEIFAQW